MTRNLTRKQLTHALGISLKTLERWTAQGCPCSRREGRPYFDYAEVTAWREARASGAALSARESLAKVELARRLTSAKKHEMELTAERALRDLDLGDRIRAAKTNEALAEISREVGALVGSGALSPSRGRAIQGLLAEARHNMKEHRAVEGDDDPRRVLLVSEEGERLLGAFEAIVSDARRARLLEQLTTEAAEDGREHPNVDTAEHVELIEEEIEPAPEGEVPS